MSLSRKSTPVSSSRVASRATKESQGLSAIPPGWAKAKRTGIENTALWKAAGLAFLLLMVFSLSSLQAQTIPTVVRIEEDWALTVNAPEQDTVAPQVMTVLSPKSDLGSTYAAFTLNHRNLPDFAGGGMQLQLWNGEMAETYTNAANDAMLNDQEAQETITWTQAMAVESGQLTFEILNGHSQTWGQFGGTDDLRLTVPTSLSNLNHYLPFVSTKNSGISYAANRVRTLTLVKIRWITSTGETYEDSNPKTVYPKSY